jgi:hypothetical protein
LSIAQSFEIDIDFKAISNAMDTEPKEAKRNHDSKYSAIKEKLQLAVFGKSKKRCCF